MLIEKEITRKPYRDIAFLLDKSTEEVKAFVSAWIDGKSIIPFEPLHQPAREKKVPAERKPREKKEKKKEAKIISRRIEHEQKTRRERSERSVFKTKVVDLSKLHQVRIDQKTCIYIKPGQDPVKAKNNYLNKLKEHKSRMLQNEKA